MSTPYAVELPEFDRADVVVVGSGSAGSTAVIAAARTGADTLLVERYGFLGGTSTMVLDSFYGFYTPATNEMRVVDGIPWEIVERLYRYDAVIERPSSYGAGQAVTYDPTLLKVVWEQTALESGVRLRLHTLVLDVLKDGDQITGLVVAGKTGLGIIRGRVFVDASGDADLVWRAGAPFEWAGADGQPAQSLTTTFRLGNVDVKATKAVKRDELVARMKAANVSGDYHLPREEGSVHGTPYPGVVVTNMTRVAYVDGTDPAELTKAEVEGRKQALEYARFLREQIPGYEQAFLMNFSTQIGIRETRRLLGETRLTREDVLTARRFSDAIAQCGAPIEDHQPGSTTRWEYVPKGGTYDIPFRALLPVGVPNLVVAGRCLSADHDAHASVRSMGQCMAMGQAAGTAAALSVRSGTALNALPVRGLQDSLRAAGALFSGASVPAQPGRQI
ncbi:MAG TPA: FAD-dependent oxidoreductase [Candidatus Limnocylindrales bacterium]|nr:FAD-dependent oxidoreductase [Candidatus Limnocylindrales bacterium]